MKYDDHDPWNEVSHRHPRANELLDDALWDCSDEEAPFGSDEGADAYTEYRDWRAENPKAPLRECIEWIGDEENSADAFTFDATIIATVLGQLVDEGHIDADVKPVAAKAIARQMKGASPERRALLRKTKAAIDAG